MSMYKVVCCVVGRGLLPWLVFSLDKTLLAFALLHFVLQGQTSLLLQVSLDLCFCIPIPCGEKDILFFFMLVVGFVGFHGTGQLQLLRPEWLGHRLGLLWCWMVCLGNKWRSFCYFEIATAFQALVDYGGCCISSKRLLPAVVGRSSELRFTHSRPF